MSDSVMNEIHQQLGELTASITNLSSRYTTVESEVNKIESSVSKLAVKLGAIETQLKDINGSRITELEGEIKALKVSQQSMRKLGWMIVSSVVGLATAAIIGLLT